MPDNLQDNRWTKYFPLWDEGFTVNVDTERKANCIVCGAVVVGSHWGLHAIWHDALETQLGR
jgi:hypothetical protein